MRHVRRYADKGNAVIFGAEKAGWIVTPGRGQHDLRAGTFQNPLEPRQKFPIDNIRKLPGIGRLVGIQDAVDIKKYNLHALRSADASVLKN